MATQLPSTARNLEQLSNTLVPLFVPSPATSTAPLLESFVAAHDELMENDSLFTHRVDLKSAKQSLETTSRELRKLNEAEEARAEDIRSGKVTEVDVKGLLSNTRKARLRSRLQNQSGAPVENRSTSRSPLGSRPATPAGPADDTKEAVMAEFADRRRVFDKEMATAHEQALSDFKKNLREHMLAEARALG